MTENTKKCPYGSEFISEFRKVIGEKLTTQDVAMCGGTCLSHITLKDKVRSFQVQVYTTIPTTPNKMTTNHKL